MFNILAIFKCDSSFWFMMSLKVILTGKISITIIRSCILGFELNLTMQHIICDLPPRTFKFNSMAYDQCSDIVNINCNNSMFRYAVLRIVQSTLVFSQSNTLYKVILDSSPFYVLCNCLFTMDH